MCPPPGCTIVNGITRAPHREPEHPPISPERELTRSPSSTTISNSLQRTASGTSQRSLDSTPIRQPSSTVARSDTSIEAEVEPTSMVLCTRKTRRRLRCCRQHRRRSSGDTTPGSYSDTPIALLKDQFWGSAASTSSQNTCLITGEKTLPFATPLLNKSTQVHLQHLLTLLWVTNLGSQVQIPSLHYCHAAVLHRLLKSILVAVTHAAFQQSIAMTDSHQCNKVPGSPHGNLLGVQQFSTVRQPASMSPRHTPTRTSPHTPQRSQT